VSNNQHGRKLALAALLCAAGVAVVAAISWKEILTHFYCRQLVKDPRRMVAMVKGEGTLDRLALPLVLKTDLGRTALLDCFLTLLTMRDDGHLIRGSLGGAQAVFLWIDERHVGFWSGDSAFYKPIGSFEHLGGYRDWDQEFDPGTFLELWTHLLRLKGNLLTSSCYPDLRFEFLSREDARAIQAALSFYLSPRLRPKVEMVLVGRRFTAPPPGSS
jgi:hypothetical protein